MRTSLSLAVLLLTVPARAAEPIAPQQLDALRTVITPGDNEDHWDRIPWHSDLWQARQVAARVGKPILLWEMDGNPLGCT